ncbi:MAG: fimbrillin family protein [Prevotella sp.]
MRKLIIPFSLAMLAGCFTSCSNDDSVDDGQEKVAVQLSADISLSTRATGSSWTNGDRIGIFMTEAGSPLTNANVSDGVSNLAYVTAGDGRFTPADGVKTIYFPIQGSVDFYAYYPHSEVSDCKVALNVANQDNQEAIDFMYATAKGKDKKQPAVTLNFSHMLSNIVLDVQPGDGLTEADLANLTITVKSQYSKAVFNIADGSIAGQSELTDIVMKAVSPGSRYEAVLLPSGANSCLLEFNLNNGSDAPFYWTMQYSLEPGMRYHFTKVRLSRTAVEVDGTILPWTETTDENENEAI